MGADEGLDRRGRQTQVQQDRAGIYRRNGVYMKKEFVTGSVIVLSALGCLRADEEGEKEAIQKRHTEWVAAWDAHEPARMASFWAADGDLLDPFGRHASGRDAVEKLLAEDHTGKGPMVGTIYSAVIDSVRFLGKDVAIIDVSAEIRGIGGPETTGPQVLKHHVTWVAEKRDDKWMAVAARPSVPAPELKSNP